MNVSELKSVLEYSETLFENASSPMITINEGGIIQKFNESACKTFGYMKEEVIGENIKMLMPEEIASHHDGYLMRYKETGEKKVIGSTREVPGMTKEGVRLQFQLKVNEVRLRGVRQYVAIMHDITGERRKIRER